MNYFITGATGFVGGRVTHQLIEAGHQVVAIARNPDDASNLAELGVSIHEGDITEKETMRTAMKGVDGVFHIAGWYKIGAEDKDPAYQVNVEGTRNVLELMQELNIPKGVYTSTLAVNSDTQGRVVDESYQFEGEHLTVYDESKAEAHKVAEDFITEGLPLVIVQPGLIYGPGDTSLVHDTLVQFLQRKLPLAPQETAYTFVHVDDVARGHVLAMEKGTPGESYFLCGPIHTVPEVLEIASDLSGVPTPKLQVPPVLMKAMAGIMKVVGKVIPLPATYSYEGLRIMAGVTYLGDNSKAKRELGFDPRPLREGLKETLEHEMEALDMEMPA
jgi:nucleoside-diphosphate-sugar epimerase